MGQFLKKILVGVSIFFLLPVGITVGMAGKTTLKGNQNMNLESFLPILLCLQMDWEYEDEALKAQAVLARSSFFLCVKKGEMTKDILRNLMEAYQNNKKSVSFQSAFEKMKSVVSETQGQVLFFNGEICEGIFHKVSAGYTRNGTENLLDTTYDYLTGVKSSVDISSKNYLHGHYFSPEALKMRIQNFFPKVLLSDKSVGEQIKIVERDASDYVTRVKIGDVTISGEELRKYLELSSANFTIQEVDGKVRFVCKGLGHGLGMSQFGANELAKEGYTYLEILEYYFPRAQVNDME